MSDKICQIKSRQIKRNCKVQGVAGEAQSLRKLGWVPSRGALTLSEVAQRDPQSSGLLHQSHAAGDRNCGAGTACLMKKFSLPKPL